MNVPKFAFFIVIVHREKSQKLLIFRGDFLNIRMHIITFGLTLTSIYYIIYIFNSYLRFNIL